MLPEITAAEVTEVMDLHREVTSIRYIMRKKQTFLVMYENLSDKAKWLITFVCWSCLFNSRVRLLDPSRFYSVPAAKHNEATFLDFIRVLQAYEGKRITTHREAALCRFLTKCDALHKAFYLMVLSRDFIKLLPMVEVQSVMDMETITMEQVYGCIKPLKTDFSELTYPIALRTVTADARTVCALAKEPMVTATTELVDGQLKPAKAPREVMRDVKVSSWPRYTLICLRDDKTFYPLACFESLKAYKRYVRKGECNTDLFDSVAQARGFIEQNYLITIDKEKPAVAMRPDALHNAIRQVAQKAETTHLLVYNLETLKTGSAHIVECRETRAVIESVWSDNGTALGFEVWLNGILYKCPFDFSGKQGAVLACPDLARDELASIYYIKLGDTPYLIGKEIEWGEDGWRDQRLRETGAWVEKCILCGSTKHPHVNHGLCRGCECNMPYYFKKYGVENWVVVSPQMRRKRHQGCWEPSLLNHAGYRHQGYLLQAREDGAWKFTEDEESMRKYEEWKKENGK